MMDIAKVTSKGQVTIPKSVRDRLELEAGSKIVFFQIGDDLVIRNASTVTQFAHKKSEHREEGFYRLTPEALPAFRRLQEAFEGFAEEEGLETEEDVVAWLEEMRQENNR